MNTRNNITVAKELWNYKILIQDTHWKVKFAFMYEEHLQSHRCQEVFNILLNACKTSLKVKNKLKTSNKTNWIKIQGSVHKLWSFILNEKIRKNMKNENDIRCTADREEVKL